MFNRSIRSGRSLPSIVGVTAQVTGTEAGTTFSLDFSSLSLAAGDIMIGVALTVTMGYTTVSGDLEVNAETYKRVVIREYNGSNATMAFTRSSGDDYLARGIVLRNCSFYATATVLDNSTSGSPYTLTTPTLSVVGQPFPLIALAVFLPSPSNGSLSNVDADLASYVPSGNNCTFAFGTEIFMTSVADIGGYTATYSEVTDRDRHMYTIAFPVS